jgi:hypothetical protein
MAAVSSGLRAMRPPVGWRPSGSRAGAAIGSPSRRRLVSGVDQPPPACARLYPWR